MLKKAKKIKNRDFALLYCNKVTVPSIFHLLNTFFVILGQICLLFRKIIGQIGLLPFWGQNLKIAQH